jgi:hypothetical protein
MGKAESELQFEIGTGMEILQSLRGWLQDSLDLLDKRIFFKRIT